VLALLPGFRRAKRRCDCNRGAHHRPPSRAACYLDGTANDVDWAYNELTGELLPTEGFNAAHKHKVVPSRKLRAICATVALAYIPDGERVYVSIDGDAFDPMIVFRAPRPSAVAGSSTTKPKTSCGGSQALRRAATPPTTQANATVRKQLNTLVTRLFITDTKS
jgi:hypothetical protein